MKSISLKSSIISLMILFFSNHLLAAKKAPQINWQELKDKSVIQGGVSKGFISLIDIRSTASAKEKQERLVFDFGGKDKEFNPEVGKYRILKDKSNNNRIIILMPKVLNTSFENRNLKSKFEKSIYIKSVNMKFDSSMLGHVFEIEIKENVRVNVKTIHFNGDLKQKRPARLVIDILGYS